MIRCSLLFVEVYSHQRDLHVLTHSFPTRRSSDLPERRCGRRRQYLRSDRGLQVAFTIHRGRPFRPIPLPRTAYRTGVLVSQYSETSLRHAELVGHGFCRRRLTTEVKFDSMAHPERGRDIETV